MWRFFIHIDYACMQCIFYEYFQHLNPNTTEFEALKKHQRIRFYRCCLYCRFVKLYFILFCFPFYFVLLSSALQDFISNVVLCFFQFDIILQILIFYGTVSSTYVNDSSITNENTIDIFILFLLSFEMV